MGVLICYDVEFPEPARVLKLKGADVGAPAEAMYSTGGGIDGVPLSVVVRR